MKCSVFEGITTNSLNKCTIHSGGKILKSGKRLKKYLLRDPFQDETDCIEQFVKRGNVLQCEPIFDILPDPFNRV